MFETRFKTWLNLNDHENGWILKNKHNNDKTYQDNILDKTHIFLKQKQKISNNLSKFLIFDYGCDTETFS